MKVALYSRKTSPSTPVDFGEGLEGWRRFATAFTAGPAAVVDDGDARAAWGPHVLRGALRRASEVDFATALVLDVDGMRRAAAGEALERFRALGCAGIAHGTWSDDPSTDIASLRLIVPVVGGAIAVSQLQNYRNRLAIVCGLENDGMTKDPSRLYFLRCRKSTSPEPYCEVFPGPLLDPGSLSDPDIVSGEMLLALSKRLATSKLAGRQSTAKAIKLAIKDSVPWESEGSRDNTAFHMAREIALAFPGADYMTVAKLFEPATSHMGLDERGVPWIDILREKFRVRYAAVAADKLKDEIHRIREFWARYGDPNRGEPYNSAEKGAISAAYNKGAGLAWLLLSPDGYHFLTHKGYTDAFASKGNDASLASATYLAPTPVRLVKSDDTPRDIREVAQQYGTTVAAIDHALYDMSGAALGSDYEAAEGGRLVLVGARQRPFTYLRSMVVEEWAGATFGYEGAELFGKWLSLFPDLRHTLAALYIRGAKGVGKGLLACGLASGWTESGHPTDLDLVLREGSWTCNLLQCPFTWADEFFPSQAGVPLTAKFRAFIGAHTHTYKRKFAHERTIRGCTRALLTSNGEMHFTAPNAALCNDDIQAIAERILALVALPEGARYMAALSPETRAELAKEGIFRHALYRALTPQRVGRFGVESADTRFVDGLTVQTGLRTLVCQWIAFWLMPSEGGNRAAKCVRVRDGHVWVSPKLLYKEWTVNLPDAMRPRSVSYVSEAVAGLSDAADGDGWQRIATGRLVAWCKATQFCSPAQLATAIGSVGGVVIPFPVQRG